MKTTPFVKVNTQNTVGIENVIPKILKPQNQQQKPVGCAAYLAAKDYFDNLRNRIKAYDPESVVDYYDIKISDHPSRSGSSTDFNVTITTKDGHDKVGSFNVERNDPNQPVDWNNIMDALANNITSIIKYYKSAPLINEDIETLKQNVDVLKQRITTTQSKTKKLEDMTQDEINKTQEVLSSKWDYVKDNVIETITDDNVVYYPVLVENTTETSETPELDKAKEELKERSIFDIVSEEDLNYIKSWYYYNGHGIGYDIYQNVLSYKFNDDTDSMEKIEKYFGSCDFSAEFYQKIVCDKKYEKTFFTEEFLYIMSLLKEIDLDKVSDFVDCKEGCNVEDIKRMNSNLIKLIQNF